MTMTLCFAQRHIESGSVTGKGIDWWWTGRDAYGDMEAVEEMAKSVEAAIREEWGDHINEDTIDDLPYEATVEWDGEDVENVTDVTLMFEFDPDAIRDPEATLAEVQAYFTTPVVLAEPMKLGDNKATVGDKTFNIALKDRSIE
jgi:hypothetical protein